jgi:hypothetical protein
MVCSAVVYDWFQKSFIIIDWLKLKNSSWLALFLFKRTFVNLTFFVDDLKFYSLNKNVFFYVQSNCYTISSYESSDLEKKKFFCTNKVLLGSMKGKDNQSSKLHLFCSKFYVFIADRWKCLQMWRKSHLNEPLLKLHVCQSLDSICNLFIHTREHIDSWQTTLEEDYILTWGPVLKPV